MLANARDNLVLIIDAALYRAGIKREQGDLHQQILSAPVILLSESLDVDNAADLLSLGVQDMLVKEKFDAGRLLQSIVFSRARKKHLVSLETDLQRFRIICKATHTMVWDWDLKSGEIQRSKEGWQMILKDRDAPTRNTQEEWANRLHPDDRKKLSEVKKAIMQSSDQDLYELESRVLRADNTYGYVLDRGFVLRDDHGKPVRVVGAAQDITDKKVAEKNVHLNEQRFRSLVQNGTDLIAILDLEGNFTYVSPTSEKMLGYAPALLLSANIFPLIHPLDQKKVKNFFKKIKPGSAVYIDKYRLKKADDSWCFLETTFNDLTGDASIQGVVANSRDITERVKADEMALAEKRHKQNEITEAIITAQEKARSLVGRELHDNVNQLLGAIRLYIDMARKDVSGADGYLKSASEFTLNAIDEIRKLSKTLVTPSLEGISLVDAVYDVINDITKVHPIRIKFSSNELDEEKLKDDFKLNLLRIAQEQVNNVLKHSKAKSASIVLKRQDKSLFFKIKDNGVGFNDIETKKGVGFTNILSRAELYKGEVKIEAIAGKGCALSILFPDDTVFTKGLSK